MDGGKGYGPGPLAGIGALGEEAVDEAVVEMARGDKAGTQLGDGVDPVGGPGRAAMVETTVPAVPAASARPRAARRRARLRPIQ